MRIPTIQDFIMHPASTDFLQQSDVKQLACRDPSIQYPIKLNRYWISGYFIREEGVRHPAQHIIEIGIDRGQMKRWMNNLQFSAYATWDGYDVDIKSMTAEADYSHLIQGDVTQDNWAPRTQYDTAVLIHFLEHLHEPEAFVERLTPSIQPGGAIIGGMPVTPEVARHWRENTIRKTAQPFGHVSVFSPKRVYDMASDLGYRVEVLTGAFLARLSDRPIENSKRWLELNYRFGNMFPSVGGEIYFRLRKNAA